jgi:hypothetical protein
MDVMTLHGAGAFVGSEGETGSEGRPPAPWFCGRLRGLTVGMDDQEDGDRRF